MPTLITDKYKPEQAKPVHEFIEKPKIVPTDFKTAVVDNKINRLDTLIRYVEGSHQKVIYFRQRLGRDDSVSQYSQDTSAAHQQYERIDGLEIVMQSGLSTSNNGSDIRTTEITGEALIEQPIIPNVGDIMLMDFGRGTLGWFGINSTRRMTHRTNTLYEIQFSLSFEITDQLNDPRMLDLNKKTVEVFKYSKDYLKAGQNPLISPKKAALFEELLEEYDRLRVLWFRKFYSRMLETCVLPNQSHITYDGFYMKAIRKWFSVCNTPEMMYFKIFDDSQFSILKNPSIWDVIHTRDKYLLKEIFTKAVAVPSSSFSNIPQFAMIRFSGFGCVVMPVEVSYTNELYLNHKDIIGKAIVINNDVSKTRMHTYQSIPLINQVLMNDSYVFSRDFYKDSLEGQSHLELQLRKYLNDNTLDIETIEALVKDVENWGEMEQYYFIPTLMILIHYGVRRM